MKKYILLNKDPLDPNDIALEEALNRERIGGRYEVFEIKEGGMGIVYLCLAQPRQMGEMPGPVALKTLKNKFLNDIKQINQFKMEADSWINLDKHDHIVRAHFITEIEGRQYIVLEWVLGDEKYGSNLRGWIINKGLDIDLSLNLAVQFCDGMIYANQKFRELGRVFVHRDLKPENILIKKDKTLKITDFGLVNIAQSYKEDFDTGILKYDQGLQIPGITKNGGIYGTPEYMSPEQFNKHSQLDTRSDIYSFGCVLFEMICGIRPFILPGSYPVTNRFEYFSLNHLHEIPPAPKKLNPNCPDNLNKLIIKCLEKDPNKRYPDFQDLRGELSEIFLSKGKKALTASQQMTANEWLNKGHSFMTLEDPVQAVDCYSKVLEIEPENETAWLFKGRALGWIENFQDALACFEKAEQFRRAVTLKKIVEGYSLKASCLDGLGRFDEAIELFDKAIHADRTNPDVWYSKGLALSKHGDYLNAIACFDECLKIAPEYIKAWPDKAIALSKIDRLNEALACCDRAIKLNRTYSPAWHTRGNVLTKLGHFKDAVDCYNTALEIHPNDQIAMENRDAVILLSENDSNYHNDVEVISMQGSTENIKAYTTPFQRILLKGKEYLLFATGEIGTTETVKNFKFPEAQLHENGNILSFGKKIGTRADIQFISKGVMQVNVEKREVKFVNEEPLNTSNPVAKILKLFRHR